MLDTINVVKKRIFTRWLSYICFKLSGRSKAEVTAPRAAIVRRVLEYIMGYLEVREMKPIIADQMTAEEE